MHHTAHDDSSKRSYAHAEKAALSYSIFLISFRMYSLLAIFILWGFGSSRNINCDFILHYHKAFGLGNPTIHYNSPLIFQKFINVIVGIYAGRNIATDGVIFC